MSWENKLTGRKLSLGHGAEVELDIGLPGQPLATPKLRVVKMPAASTDVSGDAVFELAADNPKLAATVTYRWDTKQPVLRKFVTIANRSGQGRLRAPVARERRAAREIRQRSADLLRRTPRTSARGLFRRAHHQCVDRVLSRSGPRVPRRVHHALLVLPIAVVAPIRRHGLEESRALSITVSKADEQKKDFVVRGTVPPTKTGGTLAVSDSFYRQSNPYWTLDCKTGFTIAATLAGKPAVFEPIINNGMYRAPWQTWRLAVPPSGTSQPFELRLITTLSSDVDHRFSAHFVPLNDTQMANP